MQMQETNRRDDCRAELKYIGLRISQFRKLRNLTQAQLAAKVQINRNYLSHIESGSADKAISLPLLIEISKALDVELSILVDLNDFNKTKLEFRQQFEEMKAMFEEMKQFNAELDKIISKPDEVN